MDLEQLIGVSAWACSSFQTGSLYPATTSEIYPRCGFSHAEIGST